MPHPLDGRAFTVPIERLSTEGAGVAHLGADAGDFAGMTVFVSGAVPGDAARVEITAGHARFAEARLVAVEVPSPRRVTPRCRWFGACGGCTWQMMDPAFAAQAKADGVVEHMRRIARIDPVPAPRLVTESPWGFRRTARMLIRDDVAGFRAPGTHDRIQLVTADAQPDEADCPVLTPALWALFTAVGGAVRAAGVPFGEVMLSHIPEAGAWGGRVWSNTPLDPAPFERVVAAHAGTAGLSLFHHDHEVIVGETYIPFTAPDDPLHPQVMRIDGFLQAGARVHGEMLRTVAAWCAAAAPRRVLELFSGAGNFTRVLAAPGRRVDAVEGSPGAAAAARLNAERLPGTVVTLRAAVRPELARTFARDDAGGPPDLIVLDPPRTGSPEAVAVISVLKPRTVISISCEPSTHARDAAGLAADGYRLTELVVVDQFPHTRHVETLALFQR